MTANVTECSDVHVWVLLYSVENVLSNILVKKIGFRIMASNRFELRHLVIGIFVEQG